MLSSPKARLRSIPAPRAGRAPMRRPGAVGARTQPPAPSQSGPLSLGDSLRPGVPELPFPTAQGADTPHPLSQAAENLRLYDYERSIKASFDRIVPALQRIGSIQGEADFKAHAQSIATTELGFALPQSLLADYWVRGLDMGRLFAWCVFATYRQFCDDFIADDPLASESTEAFDVFLQDCGFHTLDVSPCADGRLAHLVRYVLRLPYRAVRRKSYAGALFDIDDSLNKWIETELRRHREGQPNTADAPTRYLKVLAYHFSSADPSREGCAAHGSDTGQAAAAGLQRLLDFRQTVENSFCCGASIELLLIGVDTDTDALRLHIPDAHGRIDLEHHLDSAAVYADTAMLDPAQADRRLEAAVRTAAPDAAPGMARLCARLLRNNLAQIDYVRRFHGRGYPDTGHEERFIGAGKGFEEIQLRNLMYFAYLDTVEEAAADLDVGMRIFSSLNVRRGLPVPVVVRFDYHGQVPGARERAVQRCARVAEAMRQRYKELASEKLLHIMQVVRDCNAATPLEVLHCSVDAGPETH